MINENNVQVGSVLTIDNRPNEATVVEIFGDYGVKIETEDRCRIFFSFEELNSRKAKVMCHFCDEMTDGKTKSFGMVHCGCQTYECDHVDTRVCQGLGH